jgi:hypothetical protein
VPGYIWWRAWTHDVEVVRDFHILAEPTACASWALWTGNDCGDRVFLGGGIGAELPATFRVYSTSPFVWLEVFTPEGCTLHADLFWTYAYSHTCAKVELTEPDYMQGGIHFGDETQEWFWFGPIGENEYFHIRVFLNGEFGPQSWTVYNVPGCDPPTPFDEFPSDGAWVQFQRTWEWPYIMVSIQGPYLENFEIEIRPGMAPPPPPPPP